MLNPDELDRTYARYGFQVRESTTAVRVYTLRQGYLHGAEIVPLQPGVNTAEIAGRYATQGFAVLVRDFESTHDAHNQLFSGFFATIETSARLKNEYNTFTSKQSTQLRYKYEYIQSTFAVTDGTQNGQILDTILSAISQDGAQLVLVEAAAGYGKTSTAFEVLDRLVSQSPPCNPLFTELSRNRQAGIFRYVLLDEIDRNYHGIKSDLVQSEIQDGRVPLIIDGFDELLHKSPSAPSENDDFEQVETMLDTIGELLCGSAKVILTSRRTAIFAGDAFHVWMGSKIETSQ